MQKYKMDEIGVRTFFCIFSEMEDKIGVWVAKHEAHR